MNKLGRRRFVKELLIAGGLLAIPETIIRASTTADPMRHENLKNANIDIRNIRLSAREAFYKKEYAVAEELYRQLIALQPQAVEGYDRLAKVYLAQQKSVEACRLRLSGMTLNPNNIAFSERYAKELMRIAVGDLRAGRTMASEIDSESLFETAIKLYCTNIERAPEKKYLRFGLLDAVGDLSACRSSRIDHRCFGRSG